MDSKLLNVRCDNCGAEYRISSRGEMVCRFCGSTIMFSSSFWIQCIIARRTRKSNKNTLFSSNCIFFCLCVQLLKIFYDRFVVSFRIVDANAGMRAVREPRDLFRRAAVRVKVFRLVRRGIGILAAVQEQNGLFELFDAFERTVGHNVCMRAEPDPEHDLLLHGKAHFFGAVDLHVIVERPVEGVVHALAGHRLDIIRAFRRGQR